LGGIFLKFIPGGVLLILWATPTAKQSLTVPPIADPVRGRRGGGRIFDFQFPIFDWGGLFLNEPAHLELIIVE
jgi:hypothetical protein